MIRVPRPRAPYAPLCSKPRPLMTSLPTLLPRICHSSATHLPLICLLCCEDILNLFLDFRPDLSRTEWPEDHSEFFPKRLLRRVAELLPLHACFVITNSKDSTQNMHCLTPSLGLVRQGLLGHSLVHWCPCLMPAMRHVKGANQTLKRQTKQK